MLKQLLPANSRWAFVDYIEPPTSYFLPPIRPAGAFSVGSGFRSRRLAAWPGLSPAFRFAFLFLDFICLPSKLQLFIDRHHPIIKRNEGRAPLGNGRIFFLICSRRPDAAPIRGSAGGRTGIH